MGAVRKIGCVDGRPGTVVEFDLTARCAMLEIPDLSRYTRVIVTFSGGKDSLGVSRRGSLHS